MNEASVAGIAAPLWPHGDSSLMHLVRRAGQRATTTWSAHVSTGLSAVQYAVLVVLAEMGSCDQQTLGSRAGFDKATGTYLIDRMTHSGLIETHIDPANRRRKLISMKSAGQAALTTMIDEAKAAEAMLTESLTFEEIADLKRLLGRMTGTGYLEPGT